MKARLILNSFSDLLTATHTIILWTFTISIYFFQIIPVKDFYLSDGYLFYLILMGGLIFLSGHFLRRKMQTCLPKDRCAIKNNRQLSIIFPWILGTSLVLLITYLELIGFMIFTYSVMPDVFEIEKTIDTEKLLLNATIFTSLCIPALSFYWFLLIRLKSHSRKGLFSNRYRC